ncbi:RNA-dependent RNA polymerase [Black raspberry virus F]|uniref:RNA-dependent RNA polymerase n=1 Tax=Black raspberry virus F TaxID=463392 RepID=UPI00015C2F8F|nr:RNA-dependent RNA polymerase [Black raspberry virus F]ABU55399.1 RNA-dependent RNA polymerase [Black raspberry virus F]
MNIPVWVTIRGECLTAVDREKAKYVLAHVSYSNTQDSPGFGMFRVGKECVKGFMARCEDIWVYYVKTSTPAISLPPVVKRTMSAMYSGVEDYDFSDFRGHRFLRRKFGVVREEIIHAKNIKPPQKGEFEKSKITGEHHTHYTPDEVWEIAVQTNTMRRALLLVVDKLREISGVTEAIVSTFMAYIMFAKPQVAYLLATSANIWRAKDVNTLAEKLKEISTPLKSMHRHDVLDMTQLFELQVLVNRGIGKVDWVNERKHRQKPDTVKVGFTDVYCEARRLFELGVQRGFKYPTMDFDKYLKSRWEWVPTGSVHSQYEGDQEYIAKDYRHRSKFVTLNRLSCDQIREMFNRKPEIQAWASVKYEWAKQRAIYGVDLTSSVITNYAMFRCEDVLRHHFPIGSEADAQRVHKRLTYMLKDTESFCYDFDDFNAQHSIESMEAVLLAYYDQFKDQMTAAQASAMEWVCQSVKEMIVNNNEVQPPEKYKLKGTLLSGWRLTTFMNTVLNYIYFRISGALKTPDVVDSVHNGDDVLLSINNLKAAVEVDSRMAKIGARAQAAKCNVFSIGEFLRVDHKISREKGVGAQYLSRAAATLVHSRIESQAPLRLIEAVKAAYTRASEVAMRSDQSSEISALFFHKAAKRLSSIFGVDYEKVRIAANQHVVTGGIRQDFMASVEYLIHEEVEREKLGTDSLHNLGQVDVSDLGEGIKDYGSVLMSQYGKYTTEERIYKSIVSATGRQLSITRSTRLSVVDVRHDTKYGYGRALYGYLRNLVNLPYVEKARFVGISPLAMLDAKGMGTLRKYIMGASDVDYTLRVLL